jgi:mono/diheme cytochrome c family protein
MSTFTSANTSRRATTPATPVAQNDADARSSHQQATPEAWIEAPTPTSSEWVAQGRKLFLASCAHCHGADATGDEGPDLHDVAVSDRYISNIITHGIKHEMPSFAKKLGAPEIARLTAYVRSLEGQPAE